ncbi:hypothetical protein T265_07713 [Opisthorchis viverrini]|uniref:PH domain protein n=1 Tax=Opisthorchis viverrini TaxID=6198 RepID=A0A074ZMX3_OPIVI|nr:hypothetical protein T265_07713 [Opisthorchis viverrini]KER24665.1 hypothetical protein T265_07713 [Opisthorchis viverrini]
MSFTAKLTLLPIGLDGFVEDYVNNFKAKGVNGKWLNCVTPGELIRLGITKVGHQMIILDRIRQLQAQYCAFDNETLQMVLFRVCRACVSIVAAVNAHTSIVERQDFRDPDADAVYPGILDDLQDAVTYILNCVLTLMTAVWNAAFWLDRPPFHTLPDMISLRKFLIERALLVNNAAQLAIANQLPTHFKEVQTHVESVGDRVDAVIQGCNDSIMLTPCGMELVQLRKADAAEFGFNLESTQTNVHWIAFVQQESPAFCSGKVTRGDEVVEVNDQVVIGWQHRRVADLMRLYPKRISLRLRKRPMHATDFSGFPGGGRRHRVVAQQEPTNVPTRYLRGRVPLAAALPNASEPLDSAHDSTNPQLLLSPSAASNTIPEAQTPIYSQSSSSSSSRCPSMQFNDELLQPGSHNLDTLSYATAKSDTPPGGSFKTAYSSFPAGRISSSTPSTPFLNARSKYKAKSESDNPAPLSPDRYQLRANMESVESSPRSGAERNNSLQFRSSLSTPSKGLFSRFTLTHRRTASGGPTLWSPAKDADQAETRSVRSETGRRTTAPIVQALDKRTRSRPCMGSVDSMPKQVVGLTHRSKSFKDLVPAESNGWLWLKRSNTLLSKYGKRWCVFKNSTLYYYRHVEDQVAEGMINMNGFTVTPAPEVKYGRYPFYVHNDWIRFIFAAETETERTRWMNLLAMPSITLPDINENRSPRVGGFGPGHLAGDEDLPPRVSLRSKAMIAHSEHDCQLGRQPIPPKPGQDAEQQRLQTSANQSPLELRRNPSLGVKPLSPCVSRQDETDPSASSFIVPKVVPQVFCSLPHRSPSVPSGLSYMDGGGSHDFDESLLGCPRVARNEASPIIVCDLITMREKPSLESHSSTHSPTYMLPPQFPQRSSTCKSSPPISDATSGQPNSHRYQLSPPVRDSRQRAMSSSPLPQCHGKRSALMTSNDHSTTPTSGV